MNRPAQRFVALSAAVCYGLVALASHGLHDWIGCGEHHGGTIAAQASSPCCHGCDCESAPQPGSHKTAARPAFRTYAAGHDAATCAVCALLAKVKTSVFAVAAAPIVTQTIRPAADVPELLTSHATPRAVTARGPPASRA